MNEMMLAFRGPGLAEVLIILIVYGIVIYFIVLLVRGGLRMKKEIQRLRLEVGKLADEFEQMRQKLGKEDAGGGEDS